MRRKTERVAKVARIKMRTIKIKCEAQYVSYLESKAKGEGQTLEEYVLEGVKLRTAHRRETRLVEINPSTAMPFGKHEGQKLCVIPTGYLKWCLEEASCLERYDNLADEIRKELVRREC